MKKIQEFLEAFRTFADCTWIDVKQPLVDTSVVIDRFRELNGSIVDATDEATHVGMILHSLEQHCIDIVKFTRLETQIAVTSDQFSRTFRQSHYRFSIPEKKKVSSSFQPQITHMPTHRKPKDTACPSNKIEGDSHTLVQLSENMCQLSTIPPSPMPAQGPTTEDYLRLVHLGVAQLYAASKPPAISELWKVYEGYGTQGLLTHVWQSIAGTFFPYEQPLEEAFEGLKHESLHPLHFDDRPDPWLNDRKILYSLSKMAGEDVSGRFDVRNPPKVWLALLLGVCCAKVQVNIPAKHPFKWTCIKYIEHESKQRRGCTPSSPVESGDECGSCHGSFISVNANEADMSDMDTDGECSGD
jgi:hypothetical protein